MSDTIETTKTKITAKQESINCITVTHTTEGSEAQLVFTLIATRDGFIVKSVTSTLVHCLTPQHLAS